MDGDRPLALSAMKAAQAALAEGLDRMRVAATASGNGAPLEEGESFVPPPSPAPRGGEALFGSLGRFLPGGVGFAEGGSGRSSFLGGGSTILPSVTSGEEGSFKVLRGYESQVLTPLSSDRSPRLAGEQAGATFGGNIMFGNENEEDHDDKYPPDGGIFVSSAAGVPTGGPIIRDSRKFAPKKGPTGLLLYGPHGPGTCICGGVIARGVQGQFPDRFCLKTGCTFTSHRTKSYLGNLVRGAYYVRENESYGYLELCLTPEAALLAPPEVLEGQNNVTGWKAIIRQLQDQVAAGAIEPEVAAAQAAGIVGFAERVLKTPYATTPLQSTRRRRLSDCDLGEIADDEDRTSPSGESSLLGIQQLEDSVALLRGELGVCPPDATYHTLHGGVGAVGLDLARLNATISALARELASAAQQVQLAYGEAIQAKTKAAALELELDSLRRTGGLQVITALQRGLTDATADRAAIEATVLTLSDAVTALMQHSGGRPSVGISLTDVEDRLRVHAESVDGRLDSIRQELKGGGIKVGGVTFSGRAAAMDWARIHLPVNTYQCIGGMIYAMCLISEAVIHQDDMMKREEHGERVKRTFMQSAQVLSVHTSYPPVLDGSRVVKRESGVGFLELKSYKTWKLVDDDGTARKLEEGVERSMELITNAIESTFGSKPQARMVLLALVTEFHKLFHDLFGLEVDKFYRETLNKVGGEIPGEASKTQCWALVTKLLKTVFKATHKARSFATEAGGPNMDPLTTNGYFLYAALEELRVLREFARLKWRRHEEFGYNMLGFVFENSVSKAVLDSRPNPVLRVNGLTEELKVARANIDHIHTNLSQIRAHTNMTAMKPLGKRAKKDEDILTLN